MSHRLAGMGQEKYQHVTERPADGGNQGHGCAWTGTVRCHESALDIPGKRKPPTTYFVNSMSDTFHEQVPGVFLFFLLERMRCTPRHRYLVLTKRPLRAEQIFSEWESRSGVNPNVAVGVTACNQEEWEVKVPTLRRIPAAMRFVSVEPMLGPVVPLTRSEVDWVIVGCESGPGRRMPQRAWLQAMVGACKRLGVPLFLKQWDYGGGLTKLPTYGGHRITQRPEWFFEDKG
jgi:protein gp37